MFADPRRLGRLRLMDCSAEDIPMQAPLRALGPDPLRTRITTELLRQNLNKHVPARLLLADQGNIAGFGSWMRYGSPSSIVKIKYIQNTQIASGNS